MGNALKHYSFLACVLILFFLAEGREALIVALFSQINGTEHAQLCCLSLIKFTKPPKFSLELWRNPKRENLNTDIMNKHRKESVGHDNDDNIKNKKITPQMRQDNGCGGRGEETNNLDKETKLCLNLYKLIQRW